MGFNNTLCVTEATYIITDPKPCVRRLSQCRESRVVGLRLIVMGFNNTLCVTEATYIMPVRGVEMCCQPDSKSGCKYSTKSHAPPTRP